MTITWSDHQCSCWQRIDAQIKGEFVRHRSLDGWHFPADENRVMSERTRTAVYAGHPVGRHDLMHPDYTGVPYLYPDCPWCFGELPRPGPEGKKTRRPTRGRAPKKGDA